MYRLEISNIPLQRYTLDSRSFGTNDLTEFNRKQKTIDNIKKKNQITFFLSTKSKEVPVIFPMAKVHNQDFTSLSQIKRFEKEKQALLNLKYTIENNLDNEISIVKEFLLTHNILEESMYSLDFITKFLKWLRTDFQIDPDHGLKRTLDSVMNEETIVPKSSMNTIKISRKKDRKPSKTDKKKVKQKNQLEK